jgi:hypothetical protein
MWEPQLLANLRASTACTGITLTYPELEMISVSYLGEFQELIYRKAGPRILVKQMVQGLVLF